MSYIQVELTETQLCAVLDVVGTVVERECHDDSSRPLYQAERVLDSALLAYENATQLI